MKWSTRYKQCERCGTTEIPHHARGLCLRCYRAAQARRRYSNETPAERKARTDRMRAYMREYRSRLHHTDDNPPPGTV
jgi:hypothetical protein